jgi:hypothetical protein
MIINFSTKIRDMQNRPIQGPDKQDITLYDLVMQALLSDSGKPTAKQKFERFQLLNKLNNDKIDLKIDEIKTIKDLIGETGSTLAVGRAWAILEGGKNEE